MPMRNVRGTSMSLLMAIAMAIASVVLVWGIIGRTQRFNEWANDCLQSSGIVSKVSTSRYECFIDGAIVTLPGWELV